MKKEYEIEIVSTLKKIIMLSKVILFALLIPAVAFAAPLISNVQGEVSDGALITINGSDFGNTGPNVLFFDDYEGGTNGANILVGSGSAKVGQFASTSGTAGNPYYTNSASVSGSLAQQSNMQGIPNGGYAWSQVDLPSNTTDIFICWWLYLPSEDNAPGEGDALNWKQMWIQGASTGDDDLVVPTILGREAWSSRSYPIIANNNPYIKYLSLNFQKGVWKRLWVWVKGGYSNDGQVHYWELDGEVKTRVSDDNVTNLYSGGIFEKVRINGYGRVTNNCHPTYDDVYIATGPDARARIEIGDQSSYFDCTKLTMVTSDSWSDTVITGTVRQGLFKNGDSAYVFVVDSDGAVNPQGYPITIGSTSGALPNPPTDLRLIIE